MSTPRKNTRRVSKAIAALIFAPLAAGIIIPALAGKPAGVVDHAWSVESICDRTGYSEPGGGLCWQRATYVLIIKDADGDARRVDVSEEAFWSCWIGRFPACAWNGGGR